MDKLTHLGPSANALVVFDVVARAGSITRAATELDVSQVAVSRMIGRLEKTLNTRLFQRSRAGLALTDDGEILAAGVRQGLEPIRKALGDIENRQSRSQTVKLSLSSAFIAYWLMPRYQHFQTALPHIHLQFHAISGALEGSVDAFDLALRKSDSHEKSHQRWDFMPEVIVPVCSKAYLAAHGPLTGSTDVQRHTLIELAPTTIGWHAFLQEMALDTATKARPAAFAPLVFSDYALVLQAAMLDRGVALGWLSGVSHALRCGQVVPASNYVMRTGKRYQLISNQRQARPEVKQVKDWLIAQMHDDLTALAQHYPEYARQFQRID